jgi:hypothetical protein
LRRKASRKDFSFRTKISPGSGFFRKDVEGPDLATLKDFFRFHAATSKENRGKMTSDSLSTFTE